MRMESAPLHMTMYLPSNLTIKDIRFLVESNGNSARISYSSTLFVNLFKIFILVVSLSNNTSPIYLAP